MAVLNWAFLVVLAYIPFQLALNPTPGIDLLSMRVVIPILFVWWLGRGLVRGVVRMALTPQTLLVCGFLLFMVASVFVADQPGLAVRRLLYWGSIMPLYFVAADVLRERAMQLRVVRALIGSAVVAAIIGIVQFFGQFVVARHIFSDAVGSSVSIYMQWWVAHIGPAFWGQNLTATVGDYQSLLVNIGGNTMMRLVSLFPDPHVAAFFFALIAPLCLVVVLDPVIALSRRVRYAAYGLMLLVAVALTFSRGAYLAILLSAALLAPFVWKLVQAHTHIQMHCISRWARTALATVLIAIVVVLITPTPGNVIAARLYSSFHILDNSVSGRTDIWREAIAVIRQRPLLGVGLGNYNFYLEPAADFRTPIYAHNMYLDVAVEMGVPAAILWAMLLIYVIIDGLLVALRAGGGRAAGLATPLSSLALATASSTLIFALYALVETPLYSPGVLSVLLVMIAMGAVANGVYLQAPKREKRRHPTARSSE
ncbi:MAG: O-antigen polymerase [Parcubacteria group bacterium GW2011_GWA2_47_8]|nr:MAG: O-antigen polymerase [Parcubacteria group bacterium GW2011_GWA2_47_8]OHB18767.1 MAG: hypothetical protein A2666_02440 [Parcubacteria group bacterium RIFCSPHIGHO2_01_FULL_47_10b]